MGVFYEVYYLANNPDVAKAVNAGLFGTGWEHFLTFGSSEDRSYNEPAGYGDFNEKYYLANNPDVAKAVNTGAFGTGWEHFQNFGAAEGRDDDMPAGYGDFNEEYYLANNPDVAKAVNTGAFGSGWEHFDLFGQNEGRSDSMPAGYDDFNEVFYLARNADVAKAVNLGIFATGWEHFMQFGEAEGRVYSRPISAVTHGGALPGEVPPDTEIFTLKEVEPVEFQSTMLHAPMLMWGYTPGCKDTHADGVPVEDLLAFLTTITGLDLTELGLIDNDGGGTLDNVENIALELEGALELGDVDGVLMRDLTITFGDGTTLTVLTDEAAIAEMYFTFLNDLLYWETDEGRLASRLYISDPVWVDADGWVIDGPTYEEFILGETIVLTPTQNNDSTVEPGFPTTSDANDTIVAGRLELLHQAYIDAGAGYDILEVDAKGVYAQPLELLNIEEIRVQNLPNVYGDTAPDEYIGNAGPLGSVLDLSRATEMETLVVTEGRDTGVDLGPLTIVGVRDGATARFEGGFTQPVTLHYGEGITGQVNVELAIGDVNTDINILHNAAVLNVDSQYIENHMHSFFAGGSISRMNIEGTGAFGVDEDLSGSFNAGNPAVIDASANTGGVNLTINNFADQVTFTGTAEAYDRFTADNNGKAVIINGGNGNNEFSADNGTVVTVTAGDGNNVISAEEAAVSATITAGEGNNTIDASSAEGTVSVTTGDGDNTIETSNSKDVVVQTGAGDDNITAVNNDKADIDAGNGDNVMTVRASEANVTAGDGDDTLTLSGLGGTQIQDADGANLMFIFDLSGSMADSDIQATLDAANAVLDNFENQGIDTAVRLIAFGSDAQSDFNSTDEWMDITTAQGYLTLTQMQAMPQYGGGTNFDAAVDAGMAAFMASQGSVFNQNGVNASFFFSDGGSSFTKQTEWEDFLDQNDILSNALGFGGATLAGLEPIAYDGIAGTDISPVLSADPNDLTDDILDLLGSIEIAGGSEALIDIDLGSGNNIIELGDGDDLPGLTAYQGSKIVGENITLFVNGDSDLQAVDMSGADIASVVLDDGTPSASGAAENAILTLTDVQFAAIGAENFSVEGEVFNTYAQVHIIVTQDISLTDLGVDNLSRNIDLTLEIQNEVTLEMTAEQLHTRVAPNGVTLSNQGTDDLTGSVLITGAGLDFDPFNTNDQARTEIDGKVYYGGSLSGDFYDDANGNGIIERSEWGYNVLLDRVMNGYDRPADAPSYSRLVIDTDEISEIGPFGTLETFLSIVGTSDLTFIPVESGRDEWGRPIEGGTAIELGIDTASDTGHEFIIDFSSVTGTVSNLAVARFEDALEIYGNGARLNVELTGDVASADAGLFSRGVHTYVVTDMNGEDREFWTSRVTQDLEVLGLRGSYDDTITFGNTERGVEFLLEVEYDKFDGYAVGTLVAAFARPGAAAVVNVVGLDVLPAGEVQKVAGINLTDAVSSTVNIEGGDTVIESLIGGIEELVITSADDVAVEGDLPATLELIDASGIEGTFSGMIDGYQAGPIEIEAPFSFIGAQGGSTLILEDLGLDDLGNPYAHSIDGGVAGVELIIQDEVDLSGSTLTNVTGAHLTDGSTLTLDMAQADAIGAVNFTIDEGDTASLELMNLAEEPFALDNYAEGINVTVVGIAPLPEVTLHPDTDLTGIDSLMVPEGTVLNLTAEQFVQLALDGGAINGEGTVNVTDGTQADVDAALAAIADGVTVSMTIGSDITQGTFELITDVDLTDPDLNIIGTLGEFEYLIGANKLTLPDIDLADGVSITGEAGSTIEFTDLDGSYPAQIDASGFNVEFLRITDLLASGNNVDYIFEGLPEGVTKFIFNGDGDVAGRLQNVVIEEGTTIFGDISFNEYLLSTEVTHLSMNMEGGTRIDGDLVLSTVEVNIVTDNLIPYYLQELIINSSGTAGNNVTGNTANIIDGDITPAAYGPAIWLGSRDNNLKTVTITADQDFVVTGKILFSSHGTGTDAPLDNQPNDGITANDDDEATATLNISGDADTTIGDLDTSDDDVDYLVVNHTGSGTLTFGLSSLTTIDFDDEITVNGSATGDTIISISGEVDLSDDTLNNVDGIVLDESGGISVAGASNATLTLTQAQLNDIGAANITVNEAGMTASLNINAFEGAVPFDATELDEDIDDVDIFMAEGVQTLDPTTDLTGVDSITVPEDGTLNLTAAQFQQLNGTGTITGGDGAVINITDLTQADVDAGFDLSGVTVGADGSVTVTLAEDVDLAAGDDLGVASVIIPDTLTLGLAVWSQADGLVIDGGTDTSVIFRFDDNDGVPVTFGDSLDTSGYSVSQLHALNTFVGGFNIEALLSELASSVELVVYHDPEALGFLNPTNRMVIIEPGVTVDDQTAGPDAALGFADPDSDDEVLSITIIGEGGTNINGNIIFPALAVTDEMKLYLQSFTYISRGDGVTENELSGGTDNVISGDISPMGINPDFVDNNLLLVNIDASQDLVITGTIIFNGVDPDDDTATLNLTGDADVSIKALDTTDAEVDTLNINNLGTGTLTITGGSDSLELDNTEELFFTGTGDIVLDTDTGAGNNGIEGNELSLIDASGLDGDLTLGVIEDIDNANFSLVSGTGTTTVTIQGDTLDADAPGETGWSFDFENAGPNSEFHIGGGTPMTWTAGSSLFIDQGSNTIVYIDEDTDWSDLNLTIDQNPPIVVSDGVTLTLSAAQANGLNIIGESGVTSTGQVDVVDLGEDPVDLSGIDEAIAGYVSLGTAGTEDVTLDLLTDLGYFSVALQPNDNGDLNLSGQTIRFTTTDQAERAIDVFENAEARTSWDVGPNPGDDDNNNTNSTNVAWLFPSVPDPLDTSDYDANIGRVWVSAALVDSEGGDIEQLWTTLANSIIRVDFNSVAELNILLASNPIDRVIELASFTDIVGLTEVDDGISPEEHIETLTIEMGGEVEVGDIVIGDVVAAPDTDPTTPEFTQLTFNSRVALHDAHFLATEDYVNNNNGTNEVGETVMPVLFNTVGDIGVGGTNLGIDLLNVTINTFAPSNPGGGTQTPGTPGILPADGDDGAEFFFGTLVYDAETAGSTANFTVTGENDVTGKALDLSDPEIGAFSLDVSDFDPAANLTFTGGSPALEGGLGLETITGIGSREPIPINGGGSGDIDNTVRFGYIYDEDLDEFIIHRDGNDDPYAGIYSPELSVLDVSSIGNHSVFFGYLGAIDSNDDDTDDDGVPDTDAFTLYGNGADDAVMPHTTAIIGEAVVNGSLEVPELETGSTWRFEDAIITLTDTAVLNPGAILEFVDSVLVIDGDVDLSDIDLTLTNTPIEVPDESSLILTVTQVNALSDDVTGSGTVKVIDDPDTGDDGDDLGSINNLRTVGLDFSALTVDAEPFTVGLFNAGAIDDNGDPAGYDVIGTDFDDHITLSDQGDTVTGGPGDDTYTAGGLAEDTYNVDEGNDTIIGLVTGDVLVVSSGATVFAGDIEGEFIATAETVNDGTATLVAEAAGETTIDVSLAGGDEGFILTAEANAVTGVNGKKILIGSDNDDIINAGDSFQDSASRADELTGNGGDDQFVFDISIADTADLSATQTVEPIDEELITVDIGGDRTSYTLNINYELNGVGKTVSLDSSVMADPTDTGDIAAAMADALDDLNEVYASVSGSTVTAGGEGINSLAILSVTVTNPVGGSTDPNGTLADGTDQAQETEVLVDESVNAPNEGDIYSILVTLANGQNIGASYEVQSGDDAEAVALGLTNEFNIVAPANTVAAAHVATEDFLTLTDEDADNGGFSVALSEQGAIDGSGASKLLDGTETTLADAFADVITDFTTGEDTISLGIVDGSFGNYFEDPGQADFQAALTEANTNVFDGTVIYYLTSTADDEGLLFFDANGDGNADGVLQLLGVTNAEFDYTDIVA